MTAWHWAGWAIAVTFGSLPVIVLLLVTSQGWPLWLWPITTIVAAILMDRDLRRRREGGPR